MKEAIGGFSLFNIVIVFVLLFTGYVSISINYSKAYNIKNEIISIIKNQNGICTSNDPTSDCYNFYIQIQDYFKEVNYQNSGKCESGWIGFGRDGLRIDDPNKNVAFCVKSVSAGNSEFNNVVYYKIEVFYRFDLPIIGQLFRFSVKGETPKIYSPIE